VSLEALGLPSDADEATVRARYKELAMSAHPDRGGSAEAFQTLTDQRDQALKQVKIGNTLAGHRSALHALREAARGAKCPRCDGTGARMTQTNGFSTFKFVCTMCGGKGKLS
jgi:DnaJ-class molecular chaperone